MGRGSVCCKCEYSSSVVVDVSSRWPNRFKTILKKTPPKNNCGLSEVGAEEEEE